MRCQMEFTHLSMKKIMDQIVPISRFNKGEANKICEEVKKTGVKAVLKNNIRVMMLVEPNQYDEMVELLEDYALLFEAEERMKTAEAEGCLTQEQVMENHNITQTDLDNAEDVEIE
jgi:antitoxin StbD